MIVAPIDTNALLSILEPWIIQFGPINTLFPIFTFLEIWTLSWITVLLPIWIESFPNKVDPYQIDDFYPAFTFPKIVALGATKSVYYSWGFVEL